MELLSKMPFDIKLRILEELMMLWATKILKNQVGQYTVMHKKTNYATLFQEEKNNTWCLLPIHYPTDLRCDISDCCPEDYISISEVLQLTAKSKTFHPYLETSFIGNMIWYFDEYTTFTGVFGTGGGTPPLHQSYFPKIKNIALSADDYMVFLRLFEEVYSAMVLPEKSLIPNLESIQLHVQSGLMTRGLWEEHCITTGTTRIRYMVTLFYKMAKKYPKLVISLSGKSTNFPEDSFSGRVYAHNRSEEWVDLEGPWREFGFGYSEEEVQEFANGTSSLLRGLQQIEFADVAMGRWELEEEFHWQMEFARQWKKIWAEGLEKSEAEGGYAAVTGEYSYYASSEDMTQY